MSSDLKPITLWGRGGPNPPKVAIVLRELGLPHDIIPTNFEEIKLPWYLEINPNGRLPAIRDPNTGITLWESGAILDYLVEEYDKDNKLSFPRGTPEYYHAKQWVYFQVSGQGPYYGQAHWFKHFHSEKIPSAIERYAKEVNRVTSVLEAHLAKQEAEYSGDGPWLVGNKPSYADLSWVSWQTIVRDVTLTKDEYNEDDYPYVKAWLAKLTTRAEVKHVLEENKKAYRK
ncbi:glutathione S-transferase Ure2-like protein [Thozetella sp. PMI_491]|nr:glutathione S-transferase Ure2-like protein [Thozetella sp. PMI_491]